MEYQATHALAQALAQELGEGWTYDPARNVDEGEPRSVARLTTQSQDYTRVIVLAMERGSERAVLRAAVYDHEGRDAYLDGRPSIGARFDRGAGVIAGAIRRRLIPVARQWWQRVEEALDRRRAYDAARRRVIERCLAQMPTLETRRIHNEDPLHADWIGGWLALEPGEHGARLSLHANVDIIEAVVRAIREALPAAVEDGAEADAQ